MKLTPEEQNDLVKVVAFICALTVTIFTIFTVLHYLGKG